jgi:hypothetical protein
VSAIRSAVFTRSISVILDTFSFTTCLFSTLHKYDYTEKRDIYEPGGINSGARTIFDRLRDEKIPFYLSDWRASEVVNLKAAKRADPEGGNIFCLPVSCGNGCDTARAWNRVLSWSAQKSPGMISRYVI